MTISCFQVSVKNSDFSREIFSHSRGAAKSEYLIDIQDCCPDIKYTDLICRKIGNVFNTKAFLHTCEKRGIKLNIGQRVVVGDNTGYVVGSDCSSNIRVLFDEKSDWPKLILSVHPQEIKV